MNKPVPAPGPIPSPAPDPAPTPPPTRLPSLDLLKGFEAAARLGSFTLAARELFVTQSAVSRQVQALEAQVGARLFERTTRRLALTDAGLHLQRTTRDMLDRLRDTLDAIRAPGPDAPLTVTTTITFASLWLVPRLAAFQRQHPGVDVRIAAQNHFQDLRREGIDVAIRYCTADAAGPEAKRLFGERVLPVCSPRLLEGRAHPTHPDHLAAFALLHYEDPDRLAPWLSWHVWFETIGATPVRPAGTLRFDHYDQVVRAAIDGQGIALGRVPLVDAYLRDGRLVTPFEAGRFSTPSAERAYWIVRAPGRAPDAGTTTFVDWLLATVAAESAEGRNAPPPAKSNRKPRRR